MARGVSRLSQIDVPDRMQPVLPIIASQFLFAALCSLSAIALRMFADMWLPGAGPFALTIPAVLVATLFGRWVSGFLTQTASSLYAWYYVLPAQGSFDFVVDTDGPRVVVNMAAGFFVVALAEVFRRAVRRAMAERESLLLELEHRVKNNFASIASIVRMQAREITDPEAHFALQSTLGRIESYAHAHSLLYRGFETAGAVNMRDYLGALCQVLSDSLIAERRIRLDCEADDVEMIRERAITIGLLVNEVATNSAKHAFGEETDGMISVRFRAEKDGGYVLEVRDNGRGMPADSKPGSLGLRLIQTLTAQAAGSLETESGADGTRHTFSFAR